MGVPASYRNMNGSSINTFTLINAAGNMTLVRFHWLPLAGVQPFSLHV
jgi:catalase